MQVTSTITFARLLLYVPSHDASGIYDQSKSGLNDGLDIGP